jgi:hypothetical protein
MPHWLASQCVLATTPNVPAISGLVVNMRYASCLDAKYAVARATGEATRQ